LAGSIEFSNSSGPTIIRANARGQKLFAIASTLDKPTVEIILSKEAAQKAGIDSNSSLEKKAQALRGYTIAVDSINSVVHGYLKYFARMGGVDPEKDITVSPMAPPNMIAALKKKAIDGYTMSLPWPLIPVHGGAAIRLVSSPQGNLTELNPFAYNMVLTRADFVETKTQICAKFVAGIQHALKYMHDKPDACLEILRKPFARMNPSVLEKAFGLIRQSSSRTGKIDEISLTKAQDFMLATGILKPSEKLASFSSIYTNRFVK
jgi:ABC-type nitrate/sulfonate/bicarbonate transport system substrate-binding protein